MAASVKPDFLTGLNQQANSFQTQTNCLVRADMFDPDDAKRFRLKLNWNENPPSSSARLAGSTC
jgi:hypothetical protein